MPMTNFPNGFLAGVSIRGVPILQTNPGNVYWVSGSAVVPPGCIAGSNGNPGTFQKPFATLDYALSRCQQGAGDIIIIKPGHVENISNATTLAMDCAGVAVIGLGAGNSRPTFIFDTATTANIPVRSMSMSIQNCLFIANFADIASAFTLGSASVTASIAANSNGAGGILTVTAVGSGTLYPGMALNSAAKPGTFIMSQLSGTTGGVGTYLVNLSQTVASTTITGLVQDFNIELCEFKDTSSILNFVALVTTATVANAADGLGFLRNRVSSLGTTAATTAIKLGSNTRRLKICDNFGCSAVLNDTAAILDASTTQLTDFEFGGNVWERPNTSSTGGSFISGSGNAWTGHAYDNYLYQVDNTAGIWISTGHGSAFGYSQNFSPITGAVDRSGLINPAAV